MRLDRVEIKACDALFGILGAKQVFHSSPEEVVGIGCFTVAAGSNTETHACMRGEAGVAEGGGGDVLLDLACVLGS